MKTVDVIASGYEWICPNCNSLNKEIEFKEHYICNFCRESVDTSSPEHAYS